MSDYLDNLNVTIGAKVRCVANISSPWLTVGEVYTVLNIVAGHFVMINSEGKERVNPSGRFVLL
jgi:hypothetical protein